MTPKPKIKTVAFGVRVSPEFKRLLEVIARQECRSQAAVLEYAVFLYADSLGIPRDAEPEKSTA